MFLTGAVPFPIATDLVAMELGEPRVASSGLINARAPGADGWKALGYGDLGRAYAAGVANQAQFGGINTDQPDLSRFRDRGGKLLMYHGLSDDLIPPQGSISYYDRVAERMGGTAKVQRFYRFFLIPGMGHSFGNGTANPDAVVPIPEHDRLYRMLTAWVEKGVAPARFDVTAAAQGQTRSFPLCLYPQRPAYVGPDPRKAVSYRCS
jgi:feruloyl esterase